MTYNNLTLEQYIKCIDAALENPDRNDRELEIAAILSGKPVEVFEAMDFDKASKWISKARALELSSPSEKIKHHLVINGRVYKAITDIGQFSAARLLSLLHYNGQENRHKYLAQRIALLYTPYFSRLNEESAYPDDPLHKLDELANALLKKKVGSVYGAVFFFAKLWNSLSLDTQVCLQLIQVKALSEKVQDQDPQLPEMSGRLSSSITDGTTTSTSSPKTIHSKKTRS